jgi:hypothetical protein
MAYNGQYSYETCTGTVLSIVTTIEDMERGVYQDATFKRNDTGEEITINVPQQWMSDALYHAKSLQAEVTIDYGLDPGPNGPYRLLSVTY